MEVRLKIFLESTMLKLFILVITCQFPGSKKNTGFQLSSYLKQLKLICSSPNLQNSRSYHIVGQIFDDFSDKILHLNVNVCILTDHHKTCFPWYF